MAETRVLNPTVDLGKYRGNIVYSQTGNGKKKRCWPGQVCHDHDRFPSGPGTAHLAIWMGSGHDPQASVLGFWVVQRGHDVTQQICTPVGVTVLAANQNPSGQKEIPFRNDGRFLSIRSICPLLIQYWPPNSAPSRASRQTGRAKIATDMSHGRKQIR